MESELDKRYKELLWRLADLRGIESVRAIHSFLVEAALFCDSKMGLNLLQDISRFGLKRDMDFSKKNSIYTSLYCKFLMNVLHEKDGPDSPLNMQEELPFLIAESLRNAGISKQEIYSIMVRSVDNVDKNKLWSEYKTNVHVRESSYLID